MGGAGGGTIGAGGCDELALIHIGGDELDAGCCAICDVRGRFFGMAAGEDFK